MSNEASRGALLLGIDPGRTKCGYAAVYDDGTRVSLEVVPAQSLTQRIQRDVSTGTVAVICVGNATTSEAVLSLCRRMWPATEVALVDERNTTFEARKLYYEDHPPKGLLRLLPRGLLVPSEPLDGYAALLIVNRWRSLQAGGGGKP